MKTLCETGRLQVKITKPMLKKYSIRETSEGFIISLSLLLVGLGALGVLTGGISSEVKTANERKAQLHAQKELERQNREIEKQVAAGRSVIVDFAQNLESLPDKA